MTDLTEAKRLVEAATPGPWEDRGVGYDDHGGQFREITTPGEVDAVQGEGGQLSDEDAAFIIWSRNNLPTLIAEHEAALARVRELADELASELDSRYANMLDHPAMKRRYDRDMMTITEARALLNGNASER